jgi:hypothetical protein
MPVPDVDFVALHLALERATNVRECIGLVKHVRDVPHDTAMMRDFIEKVVERMYFCRDMTIVTLKEIFLVPSDAMDMSRFRVENMIKNWEENNGPLHKSIPLSSAGLGFFIVRIPQAFERVMGVILKAHMNGVMDLMFLASSQNFKVSAEMGEAFWPFARSLINLPVRTSDKLNFLLYKGIVAQTRVLLDPIVYHVDGLENRLVSNILLCGTTLQDKRQTRIFLQQELVVGGSIRMEDITFEHKRPCKDSFNIVVAGPYSHMTRNACFYRVTFVGGGLSVANVRKVDLVDCSFDSCFVGLSLTNIDICMLQNRKQEYQAMFEYCDTALSLQNVDVMDIRRCSFRRARQFVQAYINTQFTMVESEVMYCRSMGTIFMKQGQRADFSNNTVLLLFSGYFLDFS